MASRTRISGEDVSSGLPVDGSDRDRELDEIRRAIQGIRFGEVRVMIQDGRVVQIERVEKHRLR